MALVEKSVLLPYSAEQMFALVDNVADYPLFLPWCGGASVTEVGENKIHATVHINYLQIKQSFTTENVRQPPHNIEMTLQDGPFRSLDGNWHFTALSLICL
jgi:ribosome-associated toxin RatA of RatAB toxin-antitoxin module